MLSRRKQIWEAMQEIFDRAGGGSREEREVSMLAEMERIRASLPKKGSMNQLSDHLHAIRKGRPRQL